jgi:hypothetical protein
MLDGILDIRLIPPWTPSSVRGDLMTALARADVLQAGLGCWTIHDALVGPHLARTLGHERGFACVDLHAPTDVDALASVARRGAHLRVYYEDIPTFTDSGRKEPPSLLHAKMLLFWSKDRTAELWVGSHNWTNRAILGLNVESSIVIRLRDGAPLFGAVAKYLAKIKKISEAFDQAHVDLYKEIQRKISNGLTPVIELEALEGEALDGATIALFGTDSDDLTRLDTIRREVHVALTDPDSREQSLYPARIVHSGLLAASDASAGGVSFSPRRYAFRNGRQLPMLHREGPVNQDILNTARYFVTLGLGCRHAELLAEPPLPRRMVMQEVAEELSPVLRRLSPAARERLFRGRRARVKKPMVVNDADGGPQMFTARAKLDGASLVAMRVLRPKSGAA